MGRIRAATSHAALALLEAALIATLVVGLVAGTAFAAKGGGGKPGGGGATGGGSITGITMVYDKNTNGAPDYADQIKFTFTTSNTKPYITLLCANGTYSSSHLEYWPNIWNDPGVFTLTSPSWSGGAATCTAYLYGTTSNGGSTLLTTRQFSVGA